MPIRSLSDLRKQAGADWKDSSDEDLISAYAGHVGLDAAEVANSLGFNAADSSKTSNRFGAAIDRYQAGLYGVGEAVSGALGFGGAESALGERRRANELAADVSSLRAREQGAIESYKDVKGLADAGDYVAGLAIQSAPYAAEALVGGIGARALMSGTRTALSTAINAGDEAAAAAARTTLNRGSQAAAGAISYPSAVGDVLQNQREQAGTTDLGSAAALGVPYAALNIFGIEGTLAKGQLFRSSGSLLDDISGIKGGAARAAATGLKVGAAESFSETSQEGLNQLGRMAVDPNEEFITPQSVERFKESAVGGFVLGGVSGSIGGGFRRSEGSFLPGSTDSGSADVSNKPDNNAINNAIDEEGTPVSSINQQVAEVRQQQEAQLEQVRAQAQQETAAVAQQQAQAQQQEAEQEFKQKASMYGVTPTGAVNQYRIGNKQFFNTTQAQQFMQELDALNPNIGDELKFMIGAAVNSGALKINQTATPKSVNNSAVKFLSDYGLADATGVDDAVGRVDSIINTLEGPKALKEADVLNNFYKSITGTDAPAFVSLQQAAQQQPKLTKGASNEQLRLQDNAGLRAVSEQGGATQTGGTGTGNVRPAGLQSVQPRSIDEGSLGLQVGAVPSVGVSGSTSATGSRGNIPSANRDETQDQGQVNGRQPQVTTKKRRSVVPDQAAQRARSPEQQSEEEATNLVETVVRNVIDAVVKRRGRMSNVNLEKLKDFIYYDFSQVENRKEGIAGLTKKELAEMFDVSTDTIDGWQDIANNFFEQNRGVIQAQLYQALDDSGLTLLQLKEQIQATRENVLNDAITLEEGQTLSEVTMEDEADFEQNAIETAAAADQELTETTAESQLDQRELGAEDSGMTVMTGRKGVSVQEQNKPEETVNARYIRKAKELEAAENSGDEALAAKLSKELDDLVNEATGIAKKQVAKSEAVAGEKKGTKDAVQKRSPKGVSVRKQAEAGQGVPSKDTEGGKAATKGKADEKVSSLTLEEQAAKAWDAAAKSFPDAPKFAELTEEQQADFVSFGPENWTADDVQTELVKLAKEQKLFNKSQKTFFFDEIEEQPGLDRIRNYLEITGIPNALDFVSDWVVINEPDAEPGSIESVGGRYKVTVNVGVGNDTFVGETARHEIGHAVDQAPNGGVYSAQPEMSITLKDGVVTPVGKVARELYNLFQTSTRWGEFLAYPFDTKTFTDLDTSVKVELELFAQAFTIYTDPNAKRLLEREAPITAAYLSEVINDIQSTKPLQIQTPRNAAQRVLGFKNRYAAERPEADLGTVQRREKEAGEKQFSLAKAREQSQKQMARLPKSVGGPLQELMDNIYGFAKKGLPTFAFTKDLVDIASKFLPSAKKYVTLSDERDAIRTRLNLQVDKVLGMYAKLPADVKGIGENSVNKLIKDFTEKSKWGYDPGWIKGGVTLDPELKARFEAMPVEAQNMIKAVFAHGQSTLLLMQKSVIENINSEYDALIADAKKSGDKKEEAELTKKKAAALTDYSTLMRTNSKSPYAPLKRFGNYVVVGYSQQYLENETIANSKTAAPDVIAEAKKKLRELEKSEDHYFVQFAETRGEAKAIAREEEARIFDGEKDKAYAFVELFEKDQSNSYGGRDVQNTFYRLRNMVEESKDANLINASEKAMNRLLADLHLTLLSEQSARQSERRRRGIAGAEEDMMRSFATQGRATANFIASLSNTGSIYDVLREIKEEEKAKSNTSTREERRRYYNEIMKRHFMGMEYNPSPYVDKALSVTSMWMLLTNPTYLLQNLTQAFMMSLPVIGAKHGYTKSGKEFIKAYKEIFNVIKDGGLNDSTYGKLPADVRSVVEELVNRGRIDISLEQDLGRWRSTEDAKLAKFGRASELLRTMAQNIETVNRVATAVAAYRLESKVSNPTRALNYADKIIYDTHGSYTSGNAPRFMRTATGRLATQFRKFQLIQISLMAKLSYDAFRNEDAQTRMIGKRALAFTIGHTAVVGGAMGLPGFYALAAIYGLLFGDDDEPFNAELELRRAIGNDTIADLLTKGVPAALGADVSGKLGMGQMLSLFPYANVDMSRKGVYELVGTAITGPFGALLGKTAEGISYMGQGEYYKGVEQMLPTGLASVAKAYRFATEGVTNRAGDVLLGKEELDFVETMMTAIGLTPKQITDRQFLQATKFEFDEFYNDKASEIKRAYTRASKENDIAAQGKARGDWKKLQESRSKNGYTKQPLSSLLKAPQEQKKRERNVAGGVQFNTANKGFVRQTSEL